MDARADGDRAREAGRDLSRRSRRISAVTRLNLNAANVHTLMCDALARFYQDQADGVANLAHWPRDVGLIIASYASSELTDLERVLHNLVQYTPHVFLRAPVGTIGIYRCCLELRHGFNVYCTFGSIDPTGTWSRSPNVAAVDMLPLRESSVMRNAIERTATFGHQPGAYASFREEIAIRIMKTRQ